MTPNKTLTENIRSDIDLIEDQSVMEASLSRIFDHTQNRNIGIISACRSGDDALNRKNTSLLKVDIRQAGFGFIMVTGSYIENKGTDNEVLVPDEDSFLVVGKDGDDSGNLIGFLKKEGLKFNQDSVLYKPYDSKEAFYVGTSKNNIDVPFGQKKSAGIWHPNNTEAYMSYIKGLPSDGKPGRFKPTEKSFTFKENYAFEGYYINCSPFWQLKKHLF